MFQNNKFWQNKSQVSSLKTRTTDPPSTIKAELEQHQFPWRRSPRYLNSSAVTKTQGLKHWMLWVMNGCYGWHIWGRAKGEGKTGTRGRLQNYRGTTLLGLPGKIHSEVLKRRATPKKLRFKRNNVDFVLTGFSLSQRSWNGPGSLPSGVCVLCGSEEGFWLGGSKRCCWSTGWGGHYSTTNVGWRLQGKLTFLHQMLRMEASCQVFRDRSIFK